jgi:hypothetical protein
VLARQRHHGRIGALAQEDRAPSRNRRTRNKRPPKDDKLPFRFPFLSSRDFEWELDPENSSAEFVCKHVFSKVRGMFAKPSGTVSLDEATPANSKISAAIDVSSITTGVEERDTHLKSADFFDVAKYPAITFVSTSVSRSSATSYSVTGNLTMHGVTKPVTLAVTLAPFNHAGVFVAAPKQLHRSIGGISASAGTFRVGQGCRRGRQH